MSHELALRFSEKCYSHLEIAHFKDNFKSLADHQDDVEYWKEETLCQFLALPESIHAGSVLYAMVTYLGAFPFPSLAPCIVTREAMLKVVTILTGRYKRILQRGDQDRIKLLFRSMAMFDRVPNSLAEHPSHGDEKLQTSATGFDIDQPMNEDEDEEDDDLALAALDALDAIEVFKHDHKQDRKIHCAHIPADNFEKIVMLMLLLAPLTPQDNIAVITSDLSGTKLAELRSSSRAVVAAFVTDEKASISYSRFVKTMTMLTSQLFRPFSPLFEHFMFSKQLDLSKHKNTTVVGQPAANSSRSPIRLDSGLASSSTILNDILLAQLSFSLEITSVNSPSANSFFHSGCRIDQIYSTSNHGTSLSSFSRQVLSWRAPSLFILRGTHNDIVYTLGAYLPDPWHDSSSTHSPAPSKEAVLFQLTPRHAIFRANPTNTTIPTTHLSIKTGIALGCIIPPSSKIHTSPKPPTPGPASLLIDQDLATATLQHDASIGTGAFLTDPLLEEDQRDNIHGTQSAKIQLDIDEVEVWGISFPARGGGDGDGDDAIAKQRRLLEWEEEEAARRREVNFGSDENGARNLLEMAGIVGDDNNKRSGGSMEWRE